MTGASGFIGRRLAGMLRNQGHTVHAVSIRGDFELPHTEAVVHLAGEPVAQRWTPAAKRRILESRVEGARSLIRKISTLSARPGVLVCASAIGIYGSRGDEALTESSPPGKGFLSEVCTQWERTADLAEALGIRVVKTRIGIVLGRGGGALARMLPPFKLGVGGRLGSGRQWMSWIHLDDLAELMLFAIRETALRGPVNATAPNPVTNAEFTRTLASVLGRSAVLPAPAFALRAVFGEMSEVLLESQRVLPQAALGAGFRFRFPELEPALRDLLA